MAGYLPQNRGNRSTNRVGAAVSRRLRTADWNISPTNLKYKADGMFVTGNGDSVTVLVDFGIKSKNRDVAEGVAATVCTWAQVEGLVSIDSMESGAFFVRFKYVAKT